MRREHLSIVPSGAEADEPSPAPQFSSIEAAIEAIGRGEVVVVVDAEDRENEGDFICAAEKATAETVNFMLTGRGQLCMPILPDVARRLELSAMVEHNTAPLKTSFTVPIDHRSARTGITAQERATTIRAVIDPASRVEDFVRPGHLFPLIAKEGGVLRRAGHTEAAVDLARLAGLTPAGVLCEVLGESGDRATRDELFALAERHRLEIISIEELIRWRRRREKLVERVAQSQLPTKYGTGTVIVYDVKYEPQQPIVMVFGDVASQAAPLVRLHSSCFTGDLIESLRCDCGDQLHLALDMIRGEGAGVARLSAAGRARHRPRRKDQGLQPAGPGPGYRRGEPGPGFQGRRARLRHRPANPQRPRPEQGPAADEQPQEDRRLHLRRLSAWRSWTRCRSWPRCTSTAGGIWRRSAISWGTCCRVRRQRGRKIAGWAPPTNYWRGTSCRCIQSRSR